VQHAGLPRDEREPERQHAGQRAEPKGTPHHTLKMAEITGWFQTSR
jgi:hypothetical protein